MRKKFFFRILTVNSELKYVLDMMALILFHISQIKKYVLYCHVVFFFR